jgi:carboxymethylenebutenolidase
MHYADAEKDAGRRRHRAVRAREGEQQEEFEYKGAQHGFHNDTTPRYDEKSATLAWQRTLEFFNKNLR